MTAIAANHQQLPMKRIISTWWPLAASWLLMGIELPGISAIIARLPYPEINLAAYGGIVFPIALIIESPIIMLLPASTALSKDWDSYGKIRRFMMVLSACLTLIHILIAFSPLYYFVVEKIIQAPEAIVEPARIGLMIMTPWTWSIAYRRFNQGVLIRFGHSRTVGIGTVIRLSANWLILVAGFSLGDIPGIVVGTSAVAFGVVCEAIYIGLAVQPVLKGELRYAPPVEEPLTLDSFLKFYIPLALTSLMMLLANPIGSAAISRMPNALDSLAVWPVISGLIFMFRSFGIAYNEVVVALIDQQGSSSNLHRFTAILAVTTSVALFVIVITPLSSFWFQQISALSNKLTEMATYAIWFALPLPALSVLQSWYQGAILYGRKTRGIIESIVIYLATNILILIAGTVYGQMAGIYIGLAALTISTLTQTGWLWYRSLPIINKVQERDALARSY